VHAPLISLNAPDARKVPLQLPTTNEAYNGLLGYMTFVQAIRDNSRYVQEERH